MYFLVINTLFSSDAKGNYEAELKFALPGKERQDSVYNGLQECAVFKITMMGYFQAFCCHFISLILLTFYFFSSQIMIISWEWVTWNQRPPSPDIKEKNLKCGWTTKILLAKKAVFLEIFRDNYIVFSCNSRSKKLVNSLLKSFLDKFEQGRNYIEWN